MQAAHSASVVFQKIPFYEYMLTADAWLLPGVSLLIKVSLCDD